MTRLSIVIPSHAGFEDSRTTLDQAFALSRHPSIEVLVGDNSEDPKKLQHWSDRSDISFKCSRSPAPDGAGNFRFTSASASGNLISFLSDDDLLFFLPGFSTDKLILPEGAIGFRPTFALYRESVGIYSVSSFGLTAGRAIDRVKQYFKYAQGANSTLFSIFCSNIWKSMTYETLANHPTNGGFMDWAVVLGLISTGPLIPLPELLYIYNNKNWYTEEEISRNIPKTFLDAGLAPDCSQILPAFQALDSFTLIGRRQSPVSAEEKMEAASFAFEAYFNRLVIYFSNAERPAGLDRERCLYVQRLLAECVTHTDRIAACLLVIELWAPGLSEKYQKYMSEQLDPAIAITCYE